MRAMFLLPLLLLSCNEPSNSRLDKLEAKLTAQQQTIDLLKETVTAEKDEKELLKQEVLALRQELDKYKEVLFRDESGDLVVEGVNLHIRNGINTPDPIGENGKGNLIIGYNAAQIEGGICEGGDKHGESCESDLYCSPNSVLVSERNPENWGVCQGTVISKRRGSHNLVIGSEHSYTSTFGIVTGYRNSSTSSGATLIGGRENIATGLNAVVIGGEKNRSQSSDSVIAGGERNETTTGASASVICGGIDQYSPSVDEPCIGQCKRENWRDNWLENLINRLIAEEAQRTMTNGG